MNFFVTGVGGQLGHDVMNELLKRGHEGVGSDIQETYSGVADGSAVTKAPYVALDITDKEAVEKVITEVNPDAVIHCAAWMPCIKSWGLISPRSIRSRSFSHSAVMLADFR